MTSTFFVRAADASDLSAINAIYNYYVQHSTCTYQMTPDSMDDRRAWFAAHGPVHPIRVCEMAGEVVAWGALSSFRTREAYRQTVENSLYVRHDQHRVGLGRALLTELISLGKNLNHHTMIAGISSDQEASMALHRKFGFVEVARLREVGFKQGRWLDVAYLQLML